MTLDGCVLTFTGNKPGGWYALAIQVIINEIKIDYISSHILLFRLKIFRIKNLINQ